MKIDTAELKDIIKKDVRYNDFCILDPPTEFSKLMADRNISRVETHYILLLDDIRMIRFCGVFSWKNNKATSLDGDTYNSEMTVYGYKWMSEESILLVLVGNDW